MKSPFHLPKTVEIDGENYGIYTDFRTWIGFEIIMSSDIPHIEKCVKVLRLCYCQLPPKLDKAMEALIDFYSLGEKKRTKKKSKPLFNFEQDFGYIYASFMSEYNIDLYDSSMHWHKFLHLLRSLSEKSIFGRIVGYRGADISKIKDKRLRSQIKQMKHLYALKCDDTDISAAFDM